MRGTKARAHAKSGKWPVYKRAVVRARSCATKDSEVRRCDNAERDKRLHITNALSDPVSLPPVEAGPWSNARMQCVAL